MTDYLRERADKAPGKPKPADVPLEGIQVDTIVGLEPQVDYPGLDAADVAHFAEPRDIDATSCRWWAVRYYEVVQADGRTARVVCFTCEATYSDTWSRRETDRGLELKPSLGGGLVNCGGKYKACPCNAGDGWRSTFQTATREECLASEQDNAHCAARARELLKQRGQVAP